MPPWVLKCICFGFFSLLLPGLQEFWLLLLSCFLQFLLGCRLVALYRRHFCSCNPDHLRKRNRIHKTLLLIKNIIEGSKVAKKNFVILENKVAYFTDCRAVSFFFLMNTKKCQGTQSLGLLNSTAGKKNQSIGAWPYFFTHKLPWSQASVELTRCSKARSYCHCFSSLPAWKLACQKMSCATAATSMPDSPKYTGPRRHFSSCSCDLLCDLILLHLKWIKGIQYLAGLAPLFFALMRKARC